MFTGLARSHIQSGPASEERTSCTERGTQRRRRRARRGPASPPATPKNGGGEDRVANPDVDALKHATADVLRPAPTGTRGKSSEATGPRGAQAGGKLERAEKGWATVGRKRRGGAAKRERGAEIVDGRVI